MYMYIYIYIHMCYHMSYAWQTLRNRSSNWPLPASRQRPSHSAHTLRRERGCRGLVGDPTSCGTAPGNLGTGTANLKS